MPTFPISGTLIDFPHEAPYGPQKVLMGKVVAALDRRAHALLEAPTGSGKTLALLCASLAWQDRLKKQG
jgi:Rad3-related DNA helicase